MAEEQVLVPLAPGLEETEAAVGQLSGPECAADLAGALLVTRDRA